MAVAELARALREAVDSAGEGEIVVSIHLFGIEHYRELQDVSLRELVDAAHLHRSYVTEIRKSINLGKYVKAR